MASKVDYGWGFAQEELPSVQDRCSRRDARWKLMSATGIGIGIVALVYGVVYVMSACGK